MTSSHIRCYAAKRASALQSLESQSPRIILYFNEVDSREAVVESNGKHLEPPAKIESCNIVVVKPCTESTSVEESEVKLSTSRGLQSADDVRNGNLSKENKFKTTPDPKLLKDVDLDSNEEVKCSTDQDQNLRKDGGCNAKDGDSFPEQSPVEQVALTVPTTDDPTLTVWTIRSWILGVLSCVVLAFLNTFFSFRSEPIVITITTALIGTYPLGYFMARYFPDKQIHIPRSPESWSFSLNPSSFNQKEHTLITIFASAASVRPGGLFVVNLITIFFGYPFPKFPRLLFVLTTELLAFSFAGMMYKFLVEPAEMWWPASLVSVSLVRALHSKEKTKGINLIQFFYICMAVSFAYYLLPGYLIPTMMSMSFLCYAFPTSILAQQLGSGKKGLAIGAFSFDWASIAAFLGSPLIAPLFAVTNINAGFVFQTYVLVPFTYWRNVFRAQTFPVFSESLFDPTGKPLAFPIPSPKGQIYTSIFFAINCGQTFATFGASISHVCLFHGRVLLQKSKVIIGLNKGEPLDVHSRLMAAYPAVPMMWYCILFAITTCVAMLSLELFRQNLQMKSWFVLLGIAIATILLLPIGILMATTNQQPNVAIMSQYLMGYICPGQPIANVVFRTYSTVLCGRTISYLSNAKLGHYMKVPPRDSFIAQLIGTVISTTTSVSVAEWLKSSVQNICDLNSLPIDTPWTCPQDRVFYDHTIIWGLVGPQRMFGKDGPYMILNWFMVVGFFMPILVWIVCKVFPHHRWLRLVNMPLILQGAAAMPPASAVNNSTWVVVASFSSYYVYLRKRKWWQRYNHILSAALDAGTALMGVVLNYSLQGKNLDWWGQREECPLASCSTTHVIQAPGCHAA